jgi:hypothetical protein
MCDQVSTNILPQIFFQKFHLLQFVSFIQLPNIALESNIMVWFTPKVSIITTKILLANDKSILGVQHEKVMLIDFFDHKGIVHRKHIPHDLLMNQHFDIQVTHCFCAPNHSEQHLK